MWRGGIALLFTGCIFGTNDEEPSGEPTTDDDSSDRIVPLDEDPSSPGPQFDGAAGLEAHNEVRATAQPSPRPALAPLEWDADLADVARDWAEGCRFVHSQAPDLGENLYVASWAASLDEAVSSWASEASQYDYGTNSCSGVCGHYTQIVWRDTERVGCGYADCPAVEGVNFGGRLWVCNYDPPGNYIGQRPY